MVEKKKVPSRLRLLMQNFLEPHEPDWKPKALECTRGRSLAATWESWKEETWREPTGGTSSQSLRASMKFVAQILRV